MITSAIIGILAAHVTGIYLDARQKASITATAASMRAIGNAAVRYKTEHGHWPADVSRGQWPADFQQYLTKFDLTRTPIGGQWDWDVIRQDQGIDSAAAAVSIIEADPAWYPLIDELMDDGDLTTGIIREVSFNGRRLQYVVQKH